ncbi:MAG: hypothetical protein HOG49_24855 [Candidatus Scalindua sp.]|jgi:hypothetical protein|nr:hypothetical protein [Candidatus Scalindua sp.]
MSLYSAEEICEDCDYGKWHFCCSSFCKCKLDQEEGRNHLNGRCLFHTVKKKQDRIFRKGEVAE